MRRLTVAFHHQGVGLKKKKTLVNKKEKMSEELQIFHQYTIFLSFSTLKKQEINAQ